MSLLIVVQLERHRSDKQKTSKVDNGNYENGCWDNMGRTREGYQEAIQWRVRPVLEYNIAVWSTATKSNFNNMNLIQSQGMWILSIPVGRKANIHQRMVNAVLNVYGI